MIFVGFILDLILVGDAGQGWTWVHGQLDILVYLFLSYKKINKHENWPCMHIARKLDIVSVFGRDCGNTNMTDRWTDKITRQSINLTILGVGACRHGPDILVLCRHTALYTQIKSNLSCGDLIISCKTMHICEVPRTRLLIMCLTFGLLSSHEATQDLLKGELPQKSI